MRLKDDFRKSVFFLGYCEGDAFKAIGTAFIFGFDEGHYLVTARHVAIVLADDPFDIRINRRDGTAENINVDPHNADLAWLYHPTDDDVDIAVLPIHYMLDQRLYDILQIHDKMIVDEQVINDWRIGPGEMCYVVGLFRLMVGKKRNLPIVHCGNVATMPGDEKIPVTDWMSPTKKTRNVEGYLVEMSSLAGLSGSPVLVRPSITLGNQTVRDGHSVTAYAQSVFLLGIWQGSWRARPEHAVAVDQGSEVQVPVGIGVVVPAYKLLELLQSDDAVKERSNALNDVETRLSKTPDINSFFKNGPQF